MVIQVFRKKNRFCSKLILKTRAHVHPLSQPTLIYVMTNFSGNRVLTGVLKTWKKEFDETFKT